MLTNVMVHLFDIDSIQDPINGDRSKSIAGHRKVLGELSEVGANTFWNAHSNNINLIASVQIQKQPYKNNKYIGYKYKGEKYVYEVHNVAKGESFTKVRLNLAEVTDEDLKEMIANAIS